MWTLHDKHVLVTGGTSGIGRAAATEFARKGAHVTLLCRNWAKGEDVAAHILAETGEEPRLLLCDLSSVVSVRRAVEEYKATGLPLHVLFNNAGLVNMKRKETSEDLEETLAVNHLAVFALTTGLLDLIKASAPSRVVTVSSGAHKFSRFGIDRLQGKKGYSSMKHYGLTKLCNILFTKELSRRLAADPDERARDVTVNCFHPGAVGTNMGANNGGFAKCVMACLRPCIRSPARGADTGVFLASAPEVERVTGEYFYNRRIDGVSRDAESELNAKELWAYSEKLINEVLQKTDGE